MPTVPSDPEFTIPVEDNNAPTFLQRLDAELQLELPDPAPSLPDAISSVPCEATPATERVFEGSPSAYETLTQSSSTYFWRVLMLLAAWLHLRHFVSHRAISLILQVFRAVLLSLGAMTDRDDCPITLQTSFARLGMEDNFRIIPMCPVCHRVYPAELSPDAACTNCNVALFVSDGVRITTLPAQASRAGAAKKSVKPKLQTPVMLPSNMLPGLINSTPTMEEDLDAWRARQSQPGKMTCIQDGAIWRTLKGHDGDAFFANGLDRKEPDELRIGVTLGFDGFVCYLFKYSFGCVH